MKSITPKNPLNIIYAHDNSAITRISQLSDEDAAHLLAFYARHEYDNYEKYDDLVKDAGSTPEKAKPSNNETNSENSTPAYVNACDDPGCTNEGTHRVETWDGSIVYYCDYHYKMIEDAADKLESEGYHKCQATGCTDEGIYAIEGLNGTTEYYCYKHYKEMEDAIDMILGN